jgi:hypothetical protein
MRGEDGGRKFVARPFAGFVSRKEMRLGEKVTPEPPPAASGRVVMCIYRKM